MLRKKRIKLNGARAAGSEILSAGDEVRFFFSDETLQGCRKARVFEKAAGLDEIVFEDENLLVVNKSAGIFSQGGNASNRQLLPQILFYLQKSGAYGGENADFIPGICNRLDVNTSGLVVCGKSLHALQAMNHLFANRGIKKEYVVITHGVVGAVGETRVLEDFYEKDERRNIARVLASGSKSIVTSYTVRAVSKDFSLLSVSPITGRSHQIRVHLAHVGHPIVGDKKYGGASPLAKSQLLHCRRLEIAAEVPQFPQFPYTIGTAWDAPLPPSFTVIIKKIFTEVSL